MPPRCRSLIELYFGFYYCGDPDVQGILGNGNLRRLIYTLAGGHVGLYFSVTTHVHATVILHAMNCTEFTEMIASRIPRSKEDTQSKAACMLLHIITLMFSFGRVELEKVRYGCGKSFVADVVRRRTLVWKLGRAFNVVVNQPYQPQVIPQSLESQAKEHNIDIEAIKLRHKTIEAAIDELCTIITFMEVARSIFLSLQHIDLQCLERGYHGHCHPSYTKPKRSPLAILSKPDYQSASWLGLPASELPGARPRTEIVFEKAKFPVHTRPRTVSQSSGSTVTSSSLSTHRMKRMPSSNWSASQQRPRFAVRVVRGAAPPPPPAYRAQRITRVQGGHQNVERVCVSALYAPRMVRR
ncbi:hypothetical protein FRC08_003959 [Ceratobasidium sp. 394]|nr:hypothetical protein FRC08_003959 [Ceratobasidium sp. 394]